MALVYFHFTDVLRVYADGTPQGEVILRHDRALEGPLQLKQKLVTLRADRALTGPIRLKKKTVTLRADRAIAGPLQLKTRRPG